MDPCAIPLFFSLLSSAICGTKLTEKEQSLCSPVLLRELRELSAKHDLEHLSVYALKQNGLLPAEKIKTEKGLLKAVYRYERLNREYEALCEVLEKAKIPFLPLKGAVIRSLYPEPWMRTGCDVDVLVREEDLDRAVFSLSDALSYEKKGRTTHDVSLFSPSGIRVELHFDLIEEGRAQNAIDVLRSVWDYVTLCDSCEYQYEMSDALFYFYHIAHMAKHFESGGCGIRPFLDLWILDHTEPVDQALRDDLLARGGLLRFANAARMMNRVWFCGQEPDERALWMQAFLLHGGTYGSVENRVALNRKSRGGRFRYVRSRIFVPYAQLKRYYPILEKHRLLTPIVQVGRWLMLLNPRIAKMAGAELKANGSFTQAEAERTQGFLSSIGL